MQTKLDKRICSKGRLKKWCKDNQAVVEGIIIGENYDGVDEEDLTEEDLEKIAEEVYKTISGEYESKTMTEEELAIL